MIYYHLNHFCVFNQNHMSLAGQSLCRNQLPIQNLITFFYYFFIVFYPSGFVGVHLVQQTVHIISIRTMSKNRKYLYHLFFLKNRNRLIIYCWLLARKRLEKACFMMILTQVDICIYHE